MGAAERFTAAMIVDATIFAGSLLIHQYNISRQNPSVLTDLFTTATMIWSGFAFMQDWHDLRMVQ